MTALLLLAPALVLATAGPALAAVKRAPFMVRGSVEQVDVTGARPGQQLLLVGRHGGAARALRAGSLGGIIYRSVSPGGDYRVMTRSGSAQSPPVVVLPNRPAPPSTRSYQQAIPRSGYGYLTARDGTKLAVDVRLPGGPGPYPTLIEYAGYGYADPYNGPDLGIAQIANALGFAVVDVNIRGTGCSGGAFAYFEPLQSLDGYDVIETVARQPWVSHHKVGMLGISYGGFSQLFVAATDPPSLAAVTPLSVIDDGASIAYPGGILNTGFTLGFAVERDHDAKPASPTGGQSWALERIRQGDVICKANQALHPEAVSLVGEIRANRFYVPAVADPVSPITLVHKIKAPVYMACQWTDEQTGGHCADLAQHFTGSPHKWFTFTNGEHVDSLDPATFVRWYDFLELYVARRAPDMPASQRALGPTVYEMAMGIPGVTFPADSLQGLPSYSAALAAFQRLRSVRVLFDNGAGSSTPGAPVPSFEHSFSSFPVPGTQARSWYLAPGGTLGADAPSKAGRATFTWSKRARPATDFSGSDGPGGLWGATPSYRWNQNPRGTAVSFLSAPLEANTVIIGAGALQAWIRSSARDADLQVTISEVRPDGKEVFVQDGWLRASERKLDRVKSTLLAPVPSFRRADAAPLPKDRYALVTVPLYYEGHAYRAGSRIRITVSAPNGDQPVWSFGQTTPSGTAKVSVAFSPAMPSRLILPVVPGIAVPASLPPCPGVRGEPCRTFAP